MLAELNFIRAMVGVPSIDISARGGTNLKLDTRQVELADADAQDPAPSLASHGFGAVPFSASLPDKDIDPAYRKHFASLCAAAVEQETGARVVMGVPMAVQIRRSDAADERQKFERFEAWAYAAATRPIRKRRSASATPITRPGRPRAALPSSLPISARKSARHASPFTITGGLPAAARRTARWPCATRPASPRRTCKWAPPRSSGRTILR